MALSKPSPLKPEQKNLDSFEVWMAPKYLLSKKISQEGVQHSPQAGAQGKVLQHLLDGKKVQGEL